MVLGVSIALGLAASSARADHEAGATPALVDWHLSGCVYEGDWGIEPPGSKRLEGVRVVLAGSNHRDGAAQLIAETTTDSQGWYGFTIVPRQQHWEYYNILGRNPNGYTPVCATSVGGEVRGDDWIQYHVSDFEGTTTGDKFWDRRPAADTPTRTWTPTPTPTRAGWGISRIPAAAAQATWSGRGHANADEHAQRHAPGCGHWHADACAHHQSHAYTHRQRHDDPHAHQQPYTYTHRQRHGDPHAHQQPYAVPAGVDLRRRFQRR